MIYNMVEVCCSRGMFVLMCLVPPHIYNFPSVTVEEGESSKLVCLSHGDPSPDLTFQRTGHTEVYRIGTNVCRSLY